MPLFRHALNERKSWYLPLSITSEHRWRLKSFLITKILKKDIPSQHNQKCFQDAFHFSVDTTPIEANLKWAISKNRIDTNYPGSKIIKDQIQSGVNKIRVGIKPETRVIARGNTKIFNQDNKEIGKIITCMVRKEK